MQKQTLINQLKQQGMRLTPQRQAIYDLVCASHDHPTALAIYNQLKEAYPSLSLATVYNTLEVLAELGLVTALGHAGDDQMHYDGSTEAHINIACVQCHQIVDIPSDLIDQVKQEVKHASGYELLCNRVMYYGICPSCQKKTIKIF